jgi:lipopolysaccharide transport system ATP-binding protein
MSDIAIRVEALGKQYRIGSRQERYRTLRDSLANAASRPLWAARSLIAGNGNRGDRHETIWALKDVNFEVRRGEVLGIIGRNGAGKSTLLKILSRITEPTEGFAEIHGRVGSLLEVGTGFHPELTGRENIYLNGAILGMRRAEIERNFDEIVAFAELEKFIETPVKHYSSGMYMRLAFSVAAHLEPEILLVDEVLAVGDAAFQKKCLGRMGEVAHQGRTVFFVSHNLGHVRRLCQQGLWLNQGAVVQFGLVDTVAMAFETDLTAASDPKPKTGSGRSEGFFSWHLVGPPGSQPSVLATEGAFEVHFLLRVSSDVSCGHLGIVLQSPDGTNVAGWRADNLSLKQGLHEVICRFLALPVRPGVHYWYTSLWDGSRRVDAMRLLPELVVVTPDHSGLSQEWAGMLNVPSQIEVRTIERTPINADQSVG